MPPVPRIDLMKPEDKDWLDTELSRRGYGSLVELSELLSEKGYEISKSTLGIYAKERKERLRAIEDMRLWSRDMTATAGTDGANMAIANTFQLQLTIFRMLSEFDFNPVLEELPPEKRLDIAIKLAKMQPELSRTLITLETFKAEMMERLDQLEKDAKEAGTALDAKTLESVRAIYGF